MPWPERLFTARFALMFGFSFTYASAVCAPFMGGVADRLAKRRVAAALATLSIPYYVWVRRSQHLLMG